MNFNQLRWLETSSEWKRGLWQKSSTHQKNVFQRTLTKVAIPIERYRAPRGTGQTCLHTNKKGCGIRSWGYMKFESLAHTCWQPRVRKYCGCYQSHGCHSQRLLTFPDFFLTNVKFPWPTELPISQISPHNGLNAPLTAIPSTHLFKLLASHVQCKWIDSSLI